MTDVELLECIDAERMRLGLSTVMPLLVGGRCGGVFAAVSRDLTCRTNAGRSESRTVVEALISLRDRLQTLEVTP